MVKIKLRSDGWWDKSGSEKIGATYQAKVKLKDALSRLNEQDFNLYDLQRELREIAPGGPFKGSPYVSPSGTLYINATGRKSFYFIGTVE